MAETDPQPQEPAADPQPQEPAADPQSQESAADPLTEAFAIIREQQAQMAEQQKAYEQQITNLLRSGASAQPQVSPNTGTVQQTPADAIIPGGALNTQEDYVSLADLGKEIGKRPEK